jgi:homopolymeric O-antigen transport system permease protein
LRPGKGSAIAAAAMTVTLHERKSAAGPAASEALPPDAPAIEDDFALVACNPFAERQRLALADLRRAARLYRLCWALGWLDIKSRYRGSLLGPLWLTLSTAVMVAALGVLYSTLFRTDLRDYLPFLALSLVLWNYVQTLVSEACACFTQHDGMIRSIRMPYFLYAGRIVLRNLLVLAHTVLVIAVVDVIFGIWPGTAFLAVLPALLLWLADSLAVAVLLGAVCARFRDIPPIVASVMQIAFFVSPIIWKPELIEHGRRWLPLNPFFSLFEIVREPLLGGLPSWQVWAASLGSSLLLCGASWLLFVRVRNRLAFWL